ncbi:MAG: hypothetical protein R3185_03585 [Candidatus Thermoplasmatota archaeon]|nr:hypothetical protein [Candidatus Thermoplasmatota archaeon]
MSHGHAPQRHRPRHLALAALAGALATVALFRAPWFAAVPALMAPPWVPFDLRFVLPTLSFVAAYALGSYTRWPAPAIALPLVATTSALAAHAHASALLDFVGIAWAAPGVRISLLGLAASLASVLTSLLVALEVAQARFLHLAGEAGVPKDELGPAREAGEQLTERALTTSAIGASVLALAVRIVDQFLGDTSLPLPELFALAVVLAVGAVLTGWRARRTTT